MSDRSLFTRLLLVATRLSVVLLLWKWIKFCPAYSRISHKLNHPIALHNQSKWTKQWQRKSLRLSQKNSNSPHRLLQCSPKKSVVQLQVNPYPNNKNIRLWIYCSQHSLRPRLHSVPKWTRILISPCSIALVSGKFLKWMILLKIIRLVRTRLPIKY